LDACIKNTGSYFQQALLRSSQISRLNQILSEDSDSAVVEKWLEVCGEWQTSCPSLYQALSASPSQSLSVSTPASITTPTSTASSRSRPNDNYFNSKLAKILEDLNVVKENCGIMNSFVDEANAPRSLQSDDAVQQVYVNLVEMNRRLIVLIQRVPSEEILQKSLEVQDYLNQTISRYEKYVLSGTKQRIRQPQSPQQQQPQQQNLLGDDSNDLFLTNNNTRAQNKGKETVQQQQPQKSADLLSLDDFLGPSEPIQSSFQQQQAPMMQQTYNDPYSMDSMALELGSIQLEQKKQTSPSAESSSGFAALARRRVSKKMDVSTESPAEPNPFAEEQPITQPSLYNPQQQQQPTYSINMLDYSQQNQQQYQNVPLQQQQPNTADTMFGTDDRSGFATLARRRPQQTQQQPPPQQQQQPKNDDLFFLD
jgi:hypothetical protein